MKTTSASSPGASHAAFGSLTPSWLRCVKSHRMYSATYRARVARDGVGGGYGGVGIHR